MTFKKMIEDNIKKETEEKEKRQKRQKEKELAILKYQKEERELYEKLKNKFDTGHKE